MHVAVGNRDQPCRDPTAMNLQRIGIVGRRPTDRRQLIGNRLGLAQLDQAGGQLGIDVGAAKDHRSTTDFDVALFLLVDGGTI